MDTREQDIFYPLALRGNPAEWDKREVWKHFYRLACLFARSQDVERSLNCFIDVFLIRGDEMHSHDKDWLDFFRRQFAIYLIGKKRISCSLSEGDMIHDFLKMEWEQIQEELSGSEIPFKATCSTPWFSSLELDFPWTAAEDIERKWSVG